MTTANYVTLARIALSPLVIVFLFLDLNGLALIAFLLIALTDWVDGYIARHYNQVTDLGKFLDPLADKILVTIVLIYLVGLGRANPIPVMIIVSREFIVSGIRVIVAKSGKIIAASSSAKWKTFSQNIAIAMLIINIPYADWVLWLAVLLSVVSGGGYLWQTNLLKQSKSN
ncbi:MAG: CDP-diacylglycerol--glycerol-3-phosphate 3-phosphatidyltransferase [Candidatus Margulisiibacteriota bacterium]|nr:CDP-diacylglycerol--glycerol-3-phosphate 3-phosphatidyltransferase [Candidatus Margulisiibacteriota bacterium]